MNFWGTPTTTKPKTVNPKIALYQAEAKQAEEEAKKANSFWGLAKNTVLGTPQALKETLLPTRGYTEKELFNAKPTFKETTLAAPKLAAELFWGVGNLGSSLANKIPGVSDLSEKAVNTKIGNKVADFAPKLEEFSKPNTAGEAKAMRFVDVASNFIPAGGSLKNVAKTSKIIAGTKEVSVISKELKSLGITDDLIKSVAPKLVDETDATKIAKALDQVQLKNAMELNPEKYGIKPKAVGETKLKSEDFGAGQPSDIKGSKKYEATKSKGFDAYFEANYPKKTELLKPLETQGLKAKELVQTKPPLTETIPPKLPKDISSDIKKVNSNLNLSKINVSPEAKTIIQQTVDEVKPFIEKKIGKKLSNDEVVKQAEQSSKVLSRTIGRDETLNWQAQMLKARQELARASETGAIDENYIKNLITIKTQGTDIARKLQSLSIKADPLEATAKQAILEAVLKTNASVDDILEASKGIDFNDLKQATEFYRKFIKPTTGEWLDLVRYNSMLSSPKTHIINTFSNLLNTTLVAPIEKSLTGGLDFLGSKFTGKDRAYFAGEGASYLKNYFTNVKDATERFAGVMKGSKAYTNLDTRFIPVATKGVKGKIATTLSYPTKLLEATDQFFTALVEGAEKGALNYRAGKGVKVGNIASQAQKSASYRLYRQKPVADQEGNLLQAIDQFTVMVQGLRNNKNPIVATVSKFTVPFIQTPMNIFKQGIEYSPAGFATLAGSKNKTEQLSKAIIGSSIFAGAATLLASNRLTFGEPIDPTGKTQFRTAGMQPYSVKIGDKWVSYQKLPPGISFPLAMTAGINDAIKNKKIDDGTADLILSSVAKWGTFLADQSYAKSIGDILSAAKGGEAGIANVASNYAQQLIPYRALGGWLAKLTDDTQRKVDSKADFIDKQVQLLMMNIPGLSKQVPARLDSEGNPLKAPNNILNAFNPIQTSTQTEKQSADYENTQKIKLLNKQETADNTKAKEKIQPIYDQAQKLIAEDRQEEADALVADMTDEDYEVYKKIKTADRTKRSERLHDLLKVNPRDAVIFLRSQTLAEQERLLDNMTDEQYALYEQGK